MDAGSAVVVLADGSTNTLSDGSDHAVDGEEPNAPLYSSADLTVAGAGSLAVTGSANDGSGGQDSVVLDSGTITVEAVDDGIRGKDHLVVRDAGVTVAADGDGLESDNAEDATAGYVHVAGGSLDVTADDGVPADADVTIAGGTLTVSGSYEAVESAVITISGGDFDLTATDDGVNVSGGNDGSGQQGPGADTFAATSSDEPSLTISGGTTVVDAGGDGLDSAGAGALTGGSVTVYGPTETGSGSLDLDGGLAISGGTLLVSGSSGMAQAPSTSSAQGWIAAMVDTADAGSTVDVGAADGTVLDSWTAGKDFSMVAFSSADVESGGAYTVVVDGTEVATATAGEFTGGGMGGGVPRGGGRGASPN